jgi:phosphatidylinositol 4-kinase
MRLLQFLGSHFNATRLGSPHTEKVFIRLLNATLDGLKHSTGHPLSREIRFQIVLFGLRVLRYSIGIEFGARCLLKDRILSSALSWFSFPPQWSFGGNRLQLKAETRLLADVSIALRNVQMAADKPGPLLKTMQAKEQLLQVLIQSEISRLAVWLYPLNSPQEGYLSNLGAKGTAEVTFLAKYHVPFLTSLGCSYWTRTGGMDRKPVASYTIAHQISFCTAPQGGPMALT